MKKRIISIALSLILLTTLLLTGCEKKSTADPIDDNYRVFYQIFVGSFSDSNGDGIGDIRGIINRMDYLNDSNMNSDDSLGVQGIWLSPIFKSPSYHKYDATNYYKIDEDFGTEDDLKELIELCHERNIKLILDLAINHTSSANLWFMKFCDAQKREDTTDAYYDFYSFATDNTKISGRTYYKIDGSDGRYYEANFDSSMPELNFDSESVRAELLNVAEYYLDLGVDGFRFDAVKYIYFGDTPSSTDFWNEYTAALREIKSDVYLVGECWSNDAEVLEYYSAMNCFNFTTSQLGHICEAAKNKKANSFANYVESFQKKIKEISPDAMYCPFIANHDNDRAAGFLPVSQNQMQMAANLYILCNGSPFIYYGEEIGMKGSRGSANTDANRRLAMLWGDEDTVKNPTGSTYPEDKQTNGTVTEQKADENSILNYYIKLINIRNRNCEIARGDYSVLPCQDPVCAFLIKYNGSETVLVHNTGTEEITLELPAGCENISKVTDFIGQGEAKLSGNTLTIAPQTSAILK